MTMLTTRVRWYQQIPLRAVENAITSELLGHLSVIAKSGPPPANVRQEVGSEVWVVTDGGQVPPPAQVGARLVDEPAPRTRLGIVVP